MRIKDNVIYADDGMMLTDGVRYGKTVILAEGADVSAYSEITEEEYNKKRSEVGEF